MEYGELSEHDEHLELPVFQVFTEHSKHGELRKLTVFQVAIYLRDCLFELEVNVESIDLELLLQELQQSLKSFLGVAVLAFDAVHCLHLFYCFHCFNSFLALLGVLRVPVERYGQRRYLQLFILEYLPAALNIQCLVVVNIGTALNIQPVHIIFDFFDTVSQFGI